MNLTPEGIRNGLRRFARKAEPTQTHRRVTAPIAPKGFDPEAFFKGLIWYQKWEVFDGIFTPGINPVSEICELMQIACSDEERCGAVRQIKKDSRMS